MTKVYSILFLIRRNFWKKLNYQWNILTEKVWKNNTYFRWWILFVWFLKPSTTGNVSKILKKDSYIDVVRIWRSSTFHNRPAWERLEERVFPFVNTGVEYFGSFELKYMRKSMKRWCCLFTCLTTWAVHVEVLPSLEAQARLAAITRFIARRGKPKIILSDYGTKFVAQLEKCENRQKVGINDILSSLRFKSKSNGSSTPRCSAFWRCLGMSGQKLEESNDGNCGKKTLTDDVLFTTMCLVEQILNSRPLKSNNSIYSWGSAV